jgi:hypothetical protein
MTPADLFAANISKFAGAPDTYTTFLEHYARRMGKPVAEGTEWDAFCAQVDAEDKELAAANNVTAPLWLPEDKHGWCGINCPEGAREGLRRACDLSWGDAPGVLQAYRMMARHAPQWLSMPTDISDRNDIDSFVFSRARCFFSGAGWENWQVLARDICVLYSTCPFDPDQSRQSWLEDLSIAHKTCGWPVTLGWADFYSVPEVDGWHDWMQAIGWMHVTKHCRRDGNALVIAYRGTIDSIDSPGRGSLCPAQWKTSLSAIHQMLAALGKGGKQAAVNHALARLRLDDFIERKALGGLPGTILRGDWSTTACAARSASFLRHDLRLDGVWEARGGKIRPVEGDDEDVMDWSWNLVGASIGAAQQKRNRFEAMLPRTYQEGSPAAMLMEWFPHWIVPPAGSMDREAYFALIDAVLAASVVRRMIGALDNEFPLLLILPDDPTAEASTNQGKGLLTRALSTGMVGDIPRPRTAPDSNSAPDSRSIAAVIRQWGTVALDEFQIPSTKSHILSRDNLQSLCTGGEVTSGMAHENGDGNVSLGHSIAINSKCLDLAPDLMNRSLVLFLGPCGDAQRARVDVMRLIMSGAVGLRLRLAAIGCAERYYLAEAAENDMNLPAAKGSWRFTAHRAMAARLMMARNPGLDVETTCRALDTIAEDMNESLAQHQLAADASGLSASAETGKNIRLPWPAIWHGVSEESVEAIVASIKTAGKSAHGVPTVTVGELLRLRLDHTGQPGRMLATILSYTSGSSLRVSNIAVARAASDALKTFYAREIQESLEKKAPVWASMPGELAPLYEAAVFYKAFEGDSPTARTLLMSIRKKKQP